MPDPSETNSPITFKAPQRVWVKLIAPDQPLAKLSVDTIEYLPSSVVFRCNGDIIAMFKSDVMLGWWIESVTRAQQSTHPAPA